MNIKVGFIGAGAVGTSLAMLLSRKGLCVTGIASLSHASAHRAAQLADTYALTYTEVCHQADFLFITTPDREITGIVKLLAAQNCIKEGMIIAHTSGAHSSALLSEAKNFGAHLLSFHPLQSFRHPDKALVNLTSTVFTLEGDVPALVIARKLVEKLGGVPVEIDQSQKPLYHAGACAASNYFVAVVHLATHLLQSAGFSSETAHQALLPLIRGTLQNLENLPPEDALTGPIVRGDATTIEHHMSTIRHLCPDLLEPYKKFGQYTLDIAAAKGAITKDQENALRDQLD